MGDPAYMCSFMYPTDGGGDRLATYPIPGDYASPACLGRDSR